jgi:serine protease
MAAWDIGPFEYVAPGVPAPPTAPTGLSAAATSQSRILLTWTDASSDETGFNIFVSPMSGSGFTFHATVAAGVQSYGSTGLLPDTAYFYQVRAYNDVGESAFTSEATATTFPAPNVPPAIGRSAGARNAIIFRR